MESLIGEFPKVGKFLAFPSPEKSEENSPALRKNSEIFQREPLLGKFVENVCNTYKLAKLLKIAQNSVHGVYIFSFHFSWLTIFRKVYKK